MREFRADTDEGEERESIFIIPPAVAHWRISLATVHLSFFFPRGKERQKNLHGSSSFAVVCIYIGHAGVGGVHLDDGSLDICGVCMQEMTDVAPTHHAPFFPQICYSVQIGRTAPDVPAVQTADRKWRKDTPVWEE